LTIKLARLYRDDCTSAGSLANVPADATLPLNALRATAAADADAGGGRGRMAGERGRARGRAVPLARYVRGFPGLRKASRPFRAGTPVALSRRARRASAARRDATAANRTPPPSFRFAGRRIRAMRDRSVTSVTPGRMGPLNSCSRSRSVLNNM
jgi:hypothetical protein